MSDVQMQLAAGNYAAAIQDELGNMGATATMSQGGVVVTGSVGVAPASGSQSLRSTQPAVIISLSPAAQNILSGAQIALDVISAVRANGQGAPASASTRSSSGAPVKPGSVSQAPSLVQPSTGEVISSPSDPSISQIVQLAKSSLSDPTAVYYNFVNQVGGTSKFAAFMFSGGEEQSFVQAFNNRTLTIQNASDVAGLDLQDNTVLTGTSERVNMSMNDAWMASQDSSKGTYSTGLFIPVVGGIYVTWANPAASASSDP
jgi:hypothetical protein